MGYAAEVQGKLGMDTSSVGTDLQNATNTFNQWAGKIQQSGGGHGKGYGEQFTGSLEHHILGSRAITGALVAAAGLSAEKIADKIAEAIVHGTKEGWTEAGKLADENSKLIGERITEALTPKQLIEHYEKAQSDAASRLQAIHGDRQYDKSGHYTGTADLNAEQLKSQQEAQHDLLVAQNKLGELKKKDAEEVTKYAEKEKQDARDQQDNLTKVAQTAADILAAKRELNRTDLTAGEMAAKRAALSDLEKKNAEATAAVKKADAEAEKKAADEKQRAIDQQTEKEHRLRSLKERLYDAEKKQKQEQDKITDRSKLSLGDLANLRGKDPFTSSANDVQDDLRNTYDEDQGLTTEQVAAKNKARNIARLQKKAEDARIHGDVSGSEDLQKKIGTMTHELAQGGFVKSTEDSQATIEGAIANDTLVIGGILTDIKTVLAGKFVNQ